MITKESCMQCSKRMRDFRHKGKIVSIEEEVIQIEEANRN